MSEGMTNDLNKAIDNSAYLMKLPEKGWSTEKIVEEATRYTKFGEWLCILSMLWQANKVLLYASSHGGKIDNTQTFQRSNSQIIIKSKGTMWMGCGNVERVSIIRIADYTSEELKSI